MISTMRIVFSKTPFRSFANTMATQIKPDPQQEAMLRERCFLIDYDDRIVGQASKEACHRVQENGHLPLHRAFSVFLFNKKGDLLLQKRSAEKITYPNCYTNTCCSHPLLNYEGEEEDQNAMGVKRAAQRRLNYELGIPVESVPLEKMEYITRIHYRDEGDGKWGEHEIDYILFIRDDLKVKPNPSEISEVSFVSREELDDVLPKKGQLTPWFHLISKHRLKVWWDNLDKLNEIKDQDKILRL